MSNFQPKITIHANKGRRGTHTQKKKSQATENDTALATDVAIIREKFQNMVSTNDQITNEGNYPIQTTKIKNIEENKQKLRDL